MAIDEESNLAFKEGVGKLVRGYNSSYFLSMKGTWSRGIQHGKRIKMVCNLDVFPKGYLSNRKNVKNLAFEGEMKRGIWQGPV